tara:strand:+ start:247 stop:1047 length:801 start_codon:yes stop_codon:yes gene_type:complete
MAIITTNGSFGATAAVTSTTLNAVADAATFSDPVDGTSLELKGDGKLGIKDDGVTTAKVLDANVTVAKIGGITDSLKVIGRTTAGAGAAEEVTINDDDDLSSASAITLATDESIKAYVDSSSGIIQTALAITTTSVSTTTAIPRDNTTPLITEGVSAGLDVTMTPTSTSSTIRATLNGLLGNSNAGQYMVITIFEGNTCVGVSQIHQPSQGNDPINATFYFNPASTSEQTYSVRMGKGSSGSVGFNTSPTFGGLNKVTLFLEEISG